MTDEPTATPDEPDADEPPTPRFPRVAQLAAAPAVLALVGAVLPWFAPTGTNRGQRAVNIPEAYCLQAGRIGFLAPLAVIGMAIAVLGPRAGLFAKAQPVRSLGRDGMGILGSGLVAGAVLGIAWYFLPASYTFSGGVSWDQLAHNGVDMQRVPQVGYFISLAAAVVAVGCGGALLVAGRREPA